MAGDGGEGSGGEPSDEEEQPAEWRSNAAARDEVYRALEQGLFEHRPRLPPSREVLERRGIEQDLELKRNYGKRLLRLVTLQLVIADSVFVAYAWAGMSWELPTAVISIWLTATLVELLGIVFVVVTYLFPERGAEV